MNIGSIWIHRRLDDRGYFSILTIIMFVTIFGLAAFAVDVGNWYFTAQRAQRAADAAALAGVPNLPSSTTDAFADAQTFSTANGFEDGVDTVEVSPELDASTTRLRVTVSATVTNVFGGLFGLPTTTITRTAVADYAGPVEMGSPCNTFGQDPDPSSFSGSTCGLVNGDMWAMVQPPSAQKVNGDAYQAAVCTTEDLCTSGTNTEYQEDGYFYTLELSEAVDNLVIQAFDAVTVDVGSQCDGGNWYDGSLWASDARNDFVTDETTRYVRGPSSYCTGDATSNDGAGAQSTQFTVRDPSDSSWDPLSFPVHAGCQETYGGYVGKLRLYPLLNQTSSDYRSDLAESFRRWDTFCTISHADAGTYLIQVKTNGIGADSIGDSINGYSLRAHSSSDPTAKESISISARQRMGIYANKPSATTEFYLARIPSGSAGQILTVKLFDVGDSSKPGTVQVVAPPDSGVSFTDCTAIGPVEGILASCSFTADYATHNGKNQYIEVTIPSGYSCDDTVTSNCWVRLTYDYGSGAVPGDITSWQAVLDGDPVRLVE